MNRMLILAALAATPFLAPAAPAPAPQSSCPNTWFHEPLVVFDVTGATFIGPYDLHLVVHGNGITKLSSATEGSGPGKATFAYLAPTVARDFAIQLAALGGTTLCDDPASGADIPLKTLTILRGTTDAPAHSFSWYFGSNAHQAIEQAVNDFIAKHFPGF